MLVGQAIPRMISDRNRMITLLACIIMISWCTLYQLAGMQFRDMVAQAHRSTATPLLLNSGNVLTKEAEVSVVLWFEDGKIPFEVWTKRPTPDWIWDYKTLQTGNGKEAVTLSGHRKIDKNEEKALYTWYTNNAQDLAKLGGQVYLDERVSQAIDISAYLSQTNAYPTQWAIEDNLVSIAAYQSDMETSVMAGQDRINIQLLSRGKNNEGQTVLALPVLLGEF